MAEVRSQWGSKLGLNMATFVGAYVITTFIINIA